MWKIYSTVSEDSTVLDWTQEYVAKFAMVVRHSASRLELIHIHLDLIHSRQVIILIRLHLIHSRLDLIYILGRSHLHTLDKNLSTLCWISPTEGKISTTLGRSYTLSAQFTWLIHSGQGLIHNGIDFINTTLLKKVCHFPVPSRDATDQTLPGRE